MKTNRLSKTITAALNAQMTKEAHASQIYLSYAAWADEQGFSGIASFLFRHANEERNHMMKIVEYILKRGAEVEVIAIPAPPENPVSINNCFEKIFEHEVDNTNAIYKVVKLSHAEEDWATYNFMQWFVMEQVEEETLAMNLLDKMKIAGGEKMSSDALYSFDKDMANASDEVRPAQEATTENP
ncbi:ferritin [Flavobacterium cellulosilyticum]|uniref:Ferritin n=1 Tax=Flavobacterium cellulosilyticum TaxID=2541731 RepID=A0A4R5CHV0_9FLAO|nr:ferritin [Flavobacterium cellulosilyticum]TDD96882.1 ferritin [Flavobacterium cellulosilyticum]